MNLIILFYQVLFQNNWNFRDMASIDLQNNRNLRFYKARTNLYLYKILFRQILKIIQRIVENKRLSYNVSRWECILF